jgi:uncharacterized phage infection (PIP) family protein YhgE
MGLFSKKPKAAPTDDTPLGTPVPDQSPPAPKRNKSKKATIDPVDFMNLRAELIDVRARLDASEQAKAIVESRLAALDATTTAMATERIGMGSDDLQARVAQVEGQLREVSERAESLAVSATATGDHVGHAEPTATEPDPELLARLDELATRIEQQPDVTSRLADVEARLSEVAAKADAPPPAPPPAPVAPVVLPGPDPDTTARLDEIGEKLLALDMLSGQLSQLNARVSAQAEFGAQLSSLRDRLNEMQQANEEQHAAASTVAAAAVVPTIDHELRDRVNSLADRLTATEALSGQLGVLAERVTATDAAARHTGEQVALLEQRVHAVSNELANQIGELGRDIDGLADQSAHTAGGAVSDEVIEALRTSQVKLANEQARYEIAFRQDLATLAESLRRPAK